MIPRLISSHRKIGNRFCSNGNNSQKMALPILRLDEFCQRQFESDYSGTKIGMDKKEFMDHVNKLLPDVKLVNGYAPFCKHIFVPNFDPSILVGEILITPQNEHLLKSGYLARTPKELPVLARWFPEGSVPVPSAAFLDLILYSHEQIDKENEAMSNDREQEEYDWGIISVKGQAGNTETQMSPITMMRNALGVEEGGSGVTLDKEKYKESVDYWEKYAMIH